jgi:hypothetical protein
MERKIGIRVRELWVYSKKIEMEEKVRKPKG